MSYWRSAGDGSVLLSLHVQPGARQTALAGLHGEALKVRLNAPPVDGKANACLLAFIAKTLGVPRRNVSVHSGETSRQKVLRLEGVTEAALAALMGDLTP